MSVTPKGASTKKRVLLAAVDELREVGPTRLRLQSVAERANVTVSTVANIFDGRESLIAAAVLERITMISQELFDVTLGAMEGDFVRPAVFVAHLADPAQVRSRNEARREFVSLASMAHNNPAAEEEISRITKSHRERLINVGRLLESKGLFAPGITAIMFVRIYMGVLYGQTVFEERGGYEVSDDEWSAAMTRVASSLFTDEALEA